MKVRVLSEAEIRQVVALDQSTLDAVEAAFAALSDGRAVSPVRTAGIIGAGRQGAWQLCARARGCAIARALVFDREPGAPVVTLDEVRRAIRLLAERAKVVAEGAAATTVAAALKGACGRGKVVCVMSGGNISASPLAEILASPQ